MHLAYFFNFPLYFLYLPGQSITFILILWLKTPYTNQHAYNVLYVLK